MKQLVCKYVYDAWGNCKVLNPDGTENFNVAFIGNVNPFRYRSYYFDVETGLYYLQSRYYDPQVGRFISMDSVEYLAPDVVNGLNLYAYCVNDPVNKSDPTGCAWWNPFSWSNKTKLIVGTVAIIAGIVATVATGGALAPALAATTKAVLVSTISSAAVGATVSGINAKINGENVLDAVLEGAKDGAIDGFMWGGIFAGGSQILGGAFKIAANSGANTGKKAGIYLTKNIKILSPNSKKFSENGGTLLKIGNNFRIDVGSETLLHMHFSKFNHFPLGIIVSTIAGVIDLIL